MDELAGSHPLTSVMLAGWFPLLGLHGHNYWSFSIQTSLSLTVAIQSLFSTAKSLPFPHQLVRGLLLQPRPAAHLLLSAAPVPVWQPESLETVHHFSPGPSSLCTFPHICFFHV